jgi:small GTP-binding protein
MDTLKKKICLLGDPAVGKTSLIRRFVVDKYDDKYISTLGTKVSKKDITFTEPKSVKLTMMIWDLAGQKEFHQVHHTAFKNSAGALVVGDVTRKGTVDNVEKWIAKLYDVERGIPIILMANKHDLVDKIQVDKQYMDSLTSKLNVQYFFASAKSGENVETAFQTLGKMMIGATEAVPATIDAQAVKEERREPDTKPILELEDRLITHFCNMLGDTEIGMSIVRKQFNDAGVDFNNPTRDDLVIIVDKLVESIKVFKGDKVAKKIKSDFSHMLGQ